MTGGKHTTAEQMLTTTGLTYRQLDHWTRRGWLHEAERAGTGPGYRRRWLPGERDVADVMARLVDLGLAPDKAVTVARAATASAGGEVYCGGGVTITVAVRGQTPTAPHDDCRESELHSCE